MDKKFENKISEKEIERIKVEDTMVIDTTQIKSISNETIDEKEFKTLNIDQLRFMLEYQDHSPEEVKRIKERIKELKKQR